MSPHLLQTPEEKLTISDVLELLSRGTSSHLSFREMVEAFGERSFGALLLLLALLALFPWPPGAKAIFAVPIILIAGEMMLQLSRVWLPRPILDRQVSRSDFKRLLNAPVGLPRWARRKLISTKRTGLRGWIRKRVALTPAKPSPLQMLKKAERLTRPRWPVMTGQIADSLIGAACIGLAFMMALPVPLGDMLPGLTIALFGLGVVQRDGLFILAGMIGTLCSAVYMVLIWQTVAAILTGMADWFQALF